MSCSRHGAACPVLQRHSLWNHPERTEQFAQQEALRAKYELERAKTEAEKAIETARGEAEAIRVRGDALKDNPGVAQLEAIKKWNGVSPQTVVIGDGQNVPVVFPVK
jgi:regulator of protease activity HflC (stomatin/prohibitin superfamily)